MKVLKFGGSSVADADSIRKVVQIAHAASNTEPTIVVLSAVSGTTDTLIELGQSAVSGDGAYLNLSRNWKSSTYISFMS
jgi:aspartokinase/homoserine dehydrogenase 1